MASGSKSVRAKGAKAKKTKASRRSATRVKLDSSFNFGANGAF